MAKTMQVSLVAADREVWSGEATVVNARTLAGEIAVGGSKRGIISLETIVDRPRFWLESGRERPAPREASWGWAYRR